MITSPVNFAGKARINSGARRCPVTRTKSLKSDQPPNALIAGRRAGNRSPRDCTRTIQIDGLGTIIDPWTIDQGGVLSAFWTYKVIHWCQKQQSILRNKPLFCREASCKYWHLKFVVSHIGGCDTLIFGCWIEAVHDDVGVGEESSSVASTEPVELNLSEIDWWG